MIFTPGNDQSAVLDACVLVPMALCDLLLRLAEEPAMYRPLWSEQILTEMVKALRSKLHRSSEQAAWRRQQMKEAFPEAMVTAPPALVKAVECIPDKNDKHVLAAAIMARASIIVTQNTRHFPERLLPEVRRPPANARRFPDRSIPFQPATCPRQTGRSSNRHFPGPRVRGRNPESLRPEVLQAGGAARDLIGNIPL
jgi:predicted nucleic acid-binding protein